MRLERIALAERHRWPLWLPVALGTGAALYFGCAVEPPLWMGVGAGTLFAVFVIFAARQDGLWPRAFLALLAALSLGFAMAKLREEAVATPMLDRTVITHLTGRVVALDWGRSGLRAVLDQVRSGRLPEPPPARVRVLIRKDADTLKIGQGIGLTAQLMPPPGPATPVIASDTCARLLRRAPSAIARATCSLTAPCLSMRSAGTPIISVFAWFEYVTKPRSNHPLLPEISVMAVATMPPVHDSAVACMRCVSRSLLPARTASWWTTESVDIAGLSQFRFGWPRLDGRRPKRTDVE